MDAALLLVASNAPCPQTQTLEHLAALDLSTLNDIIIVQNKIDLITYEEALKNKEDIKKLVRETKAENSPIVPVSAVHNANVDCLLMEIVKRFKPKQKEQNCAPFMNIVRSFDINKPGSQFEDLKGGVVGGSILQGTLKVGDVVEIRPGRVLTNHKGNKVCQPIIASVLSLNSDKNALTSAQPGGLIGISLNIDPAVTRANRLAGQILGKTGEMPNIYSHLEISYKTLKRAFGVSDKEFTKVDKLKLNEQIKISCGVSIVIGNIIYLSEETKVVNITIESLQILENSQDSSEKAPLRKDRRECHNCKADST